MVNLHVRQLSRRATDTPTSEPLGRPSPAGSPAAACPAVTASHQERAAVDTDDGAGRAGLVHAVRERFGGVADLAYASDKQGVRDSGTEVGLLDRVHRRPDRAPPHPRCDRVDAHRAGAASSRRRVSRHPGTGPDRSRSPREGTTEPSRERRSRSAHRWCGQTPRDGGKPRRGAPHRSSAAPDVAW